VAASQSEEPEAVREAARHRVNVNAWNWLLLLPLVAVLFPWFYNREDPRLFDIPFFYWYQLAAIAIGVLSTLVVYRATRGDR
jgi:Na+/H+ antiporter NhaC